MSGPRLPTLSMALIAAVLATLALVASANAAFPGTNGPIAFSRGDGPLSAACSDDIWTMQPDGTGQTKVTNTPECESGPAWSPNGGHIAFARGTGRARARQDSADDPYMSCTTPPQCELTPPEWHGHVFVDGEPVTGFESTPNGWPDWAPDGKSFIFVHASGFAGPSEVVGNPYPFGTTNPGVPYDTGYRGEDPAFSPRGDTVAYSTFQFDGNGNTWYSVAVRNLVSRNEDILTSGPDSQYGPTWSPDASRIAFAREPGDIWVMDADGTNQQQVTTGSAQDNFPAWSPDGTKIAFVRCCFSGGTTELFTVEPDGTDVTRLTNDATSEWDPNWQRAAADPPGYPRAKSARRVTVPLVPAYGACQTPNREHGPPLSFGSCAPPNRLSELLTFGTPDANGEPANSSGSVTFTSIPGDPGTPPDRFVGDEADVQIGAGLTDVRRADDLSDYGPNEILALVLEMRRIDKSPYTPAGPPESATGEDFTMTLSLNCSATTSATAGARCTRTNTTFDTLVPGAIKEGHRTTWEILGIRVVDAGLDDDLETAGDNRTLAVPGLFVP